MVSFHLVLLLLSASFLVSSALSCTEQWQCASVSLDYNYVGCIGGLCKCKDGFSGDATLLSKCSCPAPKTVSWVSNQATCVAPQVPNPTETPILSCTEQWQCASVSLDYNYVLCLGGLCKCRDGFTGNATTGNKCSCPAPKIISWVNNLATCVAPQAPEPNPTETPVSTCSEQWQCASVSEDYNYVRCMAGKCACKAGFSGNATAGNKCRCPTPNTVSWVNNEANCVAPTQAPEPTTAPSTCAAQWECLAVSTDYDFVRCIAGACTCKDGFSGNATAGNKCSCLAPKIIVWDTDQFKCVDPQVPTPVDTPLSCTEQWECSPVSLDYNFVGCIAGKCACKDGFSGNATAGNKCSCLAPKIVSWVNNQATCVLPSLKRGAWSQY